MTRNRVEAPQEGGRGELIYTLWSSSASSGAISHQHHHHHHHHHRLYSPGWALASSERFLDHTQRRTTVGRTPLYEWSARRRDLYITTPITSRHPCPPVGFEPTISAGERLRTYALDRAVTGIRVPYVYQGLKLLQFGVCVTRSMWHCQLRNEVSFHTLPYNRYRPCLTEFPIHCDLVLPLSMYNIMSFS